MFGFLNNSQIEFFFWPIGKLFFFNFLMEFIVCMYLKVCVWLEETTHRGRVGYFIHDDGHMIPKNDVLVVLSPPLN